MPTLPTLDLSQAHFDRVVDTFPGDTLAAKAANYRAWLTNNLIDHVELVERQRIQVEQSVELQERLTALTQSLPSRVAFPV